MAKSRGSSLLYRRLAAGFALGLALAAALGAWGASTWFERQSRRQTETRLRDAVALLRAGLGPAPDRAQAESLLSRFAERDAPRLTLVGGNDRIVADTLGAAVEGDDLSQRPEVRAARASGVGWHLGRSPAERDKLIYLAELLDPAAATDTGYVVRAGIAWRAGGLAGGAGTVGLAAAIGALLGWGVVHLVLRKPLAELDWLHNALLQLTEGDLPQSLIQDPRDSLAPLAEAFNHMARVLASRFSQLRDGGDRLAAVVGSMVEGVIAVDERQQILLINHAARTMLEIVGPDPAGRPLWEVVRNRAVQQAAESALDSPEADSIEFESLGKSRRMLAVHPSRLPGDPPRGAVLVLHDVTELRRLETLRRDFVTNVSHELKTPLAGIKAYTETLISGAVNDAEINVRFLRRIEEQAERLHQLILDLLSLARIESGSERLEVRAVSLDELATRALGLHRATAEARGIELIDASPDGPLAVLAEEEGLRQILDNLVDNALKYTPEGGRVTVRWWRDGDGVRLEVEDTGIGIPPRVQDRIFDRFYRVDKARSRELGGTGLGLSIVKHLAQALGGNVSVSSQPGRGSVFSVWLPRA